MTPRQQEIKSRLDQGMGAKEIGEELGISRNAVYQQIQRMRRQGALPMSFTPIAIPIPTDRSRSPSLLLRQAISTSRFRIAPETPLRM